MSLFQPINLICPNCETLIVMEAVGSVNADRRPDLRDDIMENRFQDVTCHNCLESFRLQPNFNYLDAGRGQWIASMPAGHVEDHAQIAEDVTALFDKTYGKDAPAAAQDVGNELTVRLTFGWPSLREKLIVREHELDDVQLEMLKMDLMRRVPSAPLADSTELRLIDVADDLMMFAWFDTTTEEVFQDFAVRRALYDDIGENAEAWAALRDQLGDGVFVDMRKLFFTNEAAA
ncbi:MAG: CpXC domain-containing protein [Arenibacterium sp.]